jgi:hypothetical protein
MLLNLQIAQYDRQNIYSTDHISKLLQFQIALWKQLLSAIFSTAARQKIFTFLINLEKLHTSITQNNNTEVTVTTNTFSSPTKMTSPSVIDQVITNPQVIIDPYELSLAKNYYFPLRSSLPIDEMEETVVLPSQRELSLSQNHQLENLSLLQRIQLKLLLNYWQRWKRTSYLPNHNQKKNPFNQQQKCRPPITFTGLQFIGSHLPLYVTNAPSQLNLFKSFCKSLKSIDPQAQILPMHNERQIHPLSTTDQINNVDEIGLLNFFKPYKRTKKTLLGDFNIGTKLTFDEVKTHTNFTTWFHMNGYNIILYSCQTSDMVRIGF